MDRSLLPARLSSWATPAPLSLALGKGSWGRNKLSLCRKVDEAKIAALLFAPDLPSSPSCHLLFLLACSISHLPSSALDPRTTSAQFTATKRPSAINSYCLLQLQTLTGLIAVSPVWRTTACPSRGAPQSSAAATPLSPPIIHREALRTKVAVDQLHENSPHIWQCTTHTVGWVLPRAVEMLV